MLAVAIVLAVFAVGWWLMAPIEKASPPVGREETPAPMQPEAPEEKDALPVPMVGHLLEGLKEGGPRADPPPEATDNPIPSLKTPGLEFPAPGEGKALLCGQWSLSGGRPATEDRARWLHSRDHGRRCPQRPVAPHRGAPGLSCPAAQALGC